MSARWQATVAMLTLDALERIEQCRRFGMPPLADDVRDVEAYARRQALDAAQG